MSGTRITQLLVWGIFGQEGKQLDQECQNLQKWSEIWFLFYVNISTTQEYHMKWKCSIDHLPHPTPSPSMVFFKNLNWMHFPCCCLWSGVHGHRSSPHGMPAYNTLPGRKLEENFLHPSFSMCLGAQFPLLEWAVPPQATPYILVCACLLDKTCQVLSITDTG